MPQRGRLSRDPAAAEQFLGVHPRIIIFIPLRDRCDAVDLIFHQPTLEPVHTGCSRQSWVTQQGHGDRAKPGGCSQTTVPRGLRKGSWQISRRENSTNSSLTVFSIVSSPSGREKCGSCRLHRPQESCKERGDSYGTSILLIPALPGLLSLRHTLPRRQGWQQILDSTSQGLGLQVCATVSGLCRAED